MNITLKWERIESNFHDGTYRAKVVGGWLILIKSEGYKREQNDPEMVTFVPDPHHIWV